MSNVVVFKKADKAPIVVVGDLAANQKKYFEKNGWTMGEAMINKNGIPFVPKTFKFKYASDVPAVVKKKQWKKRA